MPQVPVFLQLYDAAGVVHHLQIRRAEDASPHVVAYLPDSWDDQAKPSAFKDPKHSTVMIRTFANYLSITVLRGNLGTVSVLSSEGELFNLPISALPERDSFILQHGAQFVAPCGRLVVQFCNDDIVHSSTRPPPLPEPPHEQLQPTEAKEVNKPISEQEDGNRDSGYIEESRTAVQSTGNAVDDAYTPLISAFSDETLGRSKCNSNMTEDDDPMPPTISDSPPTNVFQRPAGAESQNIPLPNQFSRLTEIADSHSPDIVDEPSGSTALHNPQPREQSKIMTDRSHELPLISTIELQPEATEEPEKDVDSHRKLNVTPPLAQSQPKNDRPDTHFNGKVPQVASFAESDAHALQAEGKVTVPEPSPKDASMDQASEDAQAVLHIPIRPPMNSAPNQVSQAVSHSLQPEQSVQHSSSNTDICRFASVDRFSSTLSNQSKQPRSLSLAPSGAGISSITTQSSSSRKRLSTDPSIPRADKRPKLSREKATKLKESQPLARTQPTHHRQPESRTSIHENSNDSINIEVDTDTIVVNSKPKRRATRQQSRSRSSTASTQLPAQPKIVLSSFNSKAKNEALKTIKRLRGQIIEDMSKADVLCVPDGQIKKTTKFVLAILLGKAIVSDKWVGAAHDQTSFPDPAAYLPKDKARERDWGFDLAEVTQRSRNSESQSSKLLSGYSVYITPDLGASLGTPKSDFRTIATTMGASKVGMGIPATRTSAESVLVLAVPDDPHAAEIGRLGHPIYYKDVLVMAALRGRLELDSDEFKLDVPIKEEAVSP
ncbi:hypothetical protein LTR64_000313 [Lithohypha guttulata]|uniref:uncharacterized protein n=1 Tax=Lithohypha guttulata TaxID=1690604 RepID=UPI002DE12123|nr:hypothetical protein LTR51_007672 [Lithohypha guttulata]